MMPHRVRETRKMELGRDAQTALERLERRRVSRRYGLDRATRYFDVRLESARLGVRGIIDLVLEAAEPTERTEPTEPTESTERTESRKRLHPVEVKRTEGGASPHHAVQLAGYALLLEERDELPEGTIDRGFILLLPSDELVPIDLTPNLRDAFRKALGDIREMLETERFPEPTKHRSFCPQCEYIRFCGDVL